MHNNGGTHPLQRYLATQHNSALVFGMHVMRGDSNPVIRASHA